MPTISCSSRRSPGMSVPMLAAACICASAVTRSLHRREDRVKPWKLPATDLSPGSGPRALRDRAGEVTGVCIRRMITSLRPSAARAADTRVGKKNAIAEPTTRCWVDIIVIAPLGRGPAILPLCAASPTISLRRFRVCPRCRADWRPPRSPASMSTFECRQQPFLPF